ncbi:MAG: response regulator [Candidatus Marinimicrobia bacterium]|nr:response regulator [Candidatus Neomarinimicrobiota bacterium]
MDNCQYRFLVIDDDPGDIELLRRHLEDISEGKAEITAFTEPVSALAELSYREFDLIFIDYILGEKTGLEVFLSIRDSGCDHPAIMLTGQGNESVAVEAMKAGVADYLVKGDIKLQSLHHTVVNALDKFKLKQQLAENQQQLAEKVHELQEALGQIKTLKGIIPICSYCKKIRDDENYWDQVESYISRFSEAEFSHGICPDCYEKHVQPQLDEINKEANRERGLNEKDNDNID